MVQVPTEINMPKKRHTHSKKKMPKKGHWYRENVTIKRPTHREQDAQETAHEQKTEFKRV